MGIHTHLDRKSISPDVRGIPLSCTEACNTMMLIVAPLYLSVIALLFAGAAKFSANLRGRGSLAWKYALIFGAVAVPLFHVGGLMRFGSWLLPFICLWLLPSLWGAWYFRTHAKTENGDPFSFKEGFILALLSVGMIVTVFFFIGIVFILVDGPPISGGG